MSVQQTSIYVRESDVKDLDDYSQEQWGTTVPYRNIIQHLLNEVSDDE